jgi:DNA-binding winged helix-turn-helix (wHTH) protein
MSSRRCSTSWSTLVQNRQRVVSKDDLIASVWAGRIVSDSTLTSRINAVRKAVGDSGGAQRLIRTIPRKGVRFVGTVLTRADDVEPVHAGSVPRDETHEPARLPLPDRPAIAVSPFLNGGSTQSYFQLSCVEFRSPEAVGRPTLICASTFVSRSIVTSFQCGGPWYEDVGRHPTPAPAVAGYCELHQIIAPTGKWPPTNAYQ